MSVLLRNSQSTNALRTYHNHVIQFTFYFSLTSFLRLCVLLFLFVQQQNKTRRIPRVLLSIRYAYS